MNFDWSHPWILDGAAWLLTYAVHSTVLITLVWLLSTAISHTLKQRRHACADSLWKLALVGGLITSVLQASLGVTPLAGQVRLVEDPAASSFDADENAVQEPSSNEIASRHRPEGEKISFRAFMRADAVATLDDEVRESRTRSLQGPLDLNFPSSKDPIVKLVGPDRSIAQGSMAASSDLTPIDVSNHDHEIATSSAGSITKAVSNSFEKGLVAIWAMGALIATLVMIRRRRRLARILSDRRPLRETKPLAILDRLQARAGLSQRTIRLSISENLTGPIALGRSEICLPERAVLELNPEQQESMLAHELAHLVRRDPSWLVLSGVMESLFFFQPLNKLARRRQQEAAEFLCDDWAVSQTGRSLPLARSLAEVAAWVTPQRLPTPVSSMAKKGSSLVRRIENILDQGRESSSRKPRLLIGAMSMGLIAMVVWVAPGAAAIGQEESKEATIAADIAALKAPPAPQTRKLGVTLGNLDDALAAQLGVGGGALLIDGVQEGSAADRAGLKRFDVIKGIDGRAASVERLRKVLASKAKSFDLTVIRKGRAMEVEVSFGSKSKKSKRAKDRPKRRDHRDHDEPEIEINLEGLEALGELEIEGLEGIEDLGEHIEEMLEGLEPAIEQAIEEAQERGFEVEFDDDFDVDIKGLRELEGLGGRIEEMLEGLEPAIERAIEEAQEKGYEIELDNDVELDEETKARLEALGERLERRFEALGEKFEHRGEAFGERLERRVESLEERIESRGERLEEEIERRAERFEKRLEKFDGDWERAVKELGPVLEELMEGIEPEINAIIGELEPEIEAVIKDIEPEIEGFLRDLGPELEEALNELGPAIEEIERELDKARKKSKGSKKSKKSRKGKRRIVARDHDHEHEHEHENEHVVSFEELDQEQRREVERALEAVKDVDVEKHVRRALEHVDKVESKHVRGAIEQVMEALEHVDVEEHVKRALEHAHRPSKKHHEHAHRNVIRFEDLDAEQQRQVKRALEAVENINVDEHVREAMEHIENANIHETIREALKGLDGLNIDVQDFSDLKKLEGLGDRIRQRIEKRVEKESKDDDRPKRRSKKKTRIIADSSSDSGTPVAGS